MLAGGTGPGGYYTLCMLQILAIFPVLYYLLNRNPIQGMVLICAVNIIWEVAVKYGIITQGLHRISSARLLVGVALGILISLYWQQLKKSVIPALFFVFGSVFLIHYTFLGYKPQLVGSWITSSFASIPYAAGIVYFMIARENLWQKITNSNIVMKRLSGCIQYIGNATYHIFLVQQLYFCLSPHELVGGSKGMIKDSLMDLCLCISIGCVFFAIENKCRVLLSKRGRKALLQAEN